MVPVYYDMQKKQKTVIGLAVAMAFTLALHTPVRAADAPTCENGRAPLCLGYGEKVVSSNSVCFDQFKCDGEGFICKSELDGLAAEHKELLGKHNELVNRYNELVGTYESTVSAYQKYQRCVTLAANISDAQACEPES
jgi:hypothetical protein